MRKFIIFLVICMLSTTCAFGAGVTKKTSKAIDIEMETKDGFLLNSRLYLPKEKRKKYPLVLLLHSVGYSSYYWGDLQTNFNKAGFAVLELDFRGHGKSINTAKFKKVNWRYMPQKVYAKYPNDVLQLLVYMHDNYKNISVSKLVIVGADVGANTAILASSSLKTKPYAMVLLSPQVKFKGLYTPVAFAELGNIPTFVAISAKDTHSKQQAYYLKKFAQGKFVIKTYPYGGMGMLMLKVNKNMSLDIVNWSVQEFNSHVAHPNTSSNKATNKKPSSKTK